MVIIHKKKSNNTHIYRQLYFAINEREFPFPSGYRSAFSLPHIIPFRFSWVIKLLNVSLHKAWHHAYVSQSLRPVQAASIHIQNLWIIALLYFVFVQSNNIGYFKLSVLATGGTGLLQGWLKGMTWMMTNLLLTSMKYEWGRSILIHCILF